MKRIIWLASYPKSGNTWLRIFLANLTSEGDQPANINDLGGNHVASSREAFGEAVGIDAGDLTHAEVDAMRPDVYRATARRAARTPYVKVHDAYQRLEGSELLFPSDVTRGAVYLVRNPLDVCVSFAHHIGGVELENMVRYMADPDHAMSAGTERQHHQLRQKLSSWSAHVESWANAEIPLHLVRYEDLHFRPVETFGGAATFLGIPHDRRALEEAIARSSFDQVQEQERREGFRERPSVATSFFRKGEVGSWREALTPELAEQITTTHGEVMRRLGYLSPEGEIVF